MLFPRASGKLRPPGFPTTSSKASSHGLKAPCPPVSLRMLVSAGRGTSGEPLALRSGGHVPVTSVAITTQILSPELGTRLPAACPGHTSKFRCTNAAQLLTTATIVASPLPPPPPNTGSLSAVTWRAPRRSAARAGTWAVSHSCSFPAMASQISQNPLLYWLL